MPEKIAVCTAGGAIASFHAAFKRMLEVLEETAPGRFELVGAWGGLSGLINGDFRPIRYGQVEQDRAGSMIGADRKLAETERIAKAVRDHHIHAVIMMGGDNHLGEADKCHDVGVPIVGYPKTMDGDLSSGVTLGWESAVAVGARATRLHHHTAMTFERVFYVGLFGRDTDWTVTAVTAYGGGDVGIPCEREYALETVLEKVESAYEANRMRYGRGFAVIPYSEGARINGVNPPPEEHRSLDAFGLPKLQPEWLGLELVRHTKGVGKAAAFQAHTYDMRDAPPTATDRALSAMAGEECIRMILDADFGKAVVFEPQDDFYRVGRAPLEDVCKQRRVRDTGYFDYDQLRPAGSFARDYGRLFRRSLGDPPAKDELVYKNML